jgi:hypothetical protein
MENFASIFACENAEIVEPHRTNPLRERLDPTWKDARMEANEPNLTPERRLIVLPRDVQSRMLNFEPRRACEPRIEKALPI